VRIEVHSLET